MSTHQLSLPVHNPTTPYSCMPTNNHHDDTIMNQYEKKKNKQPKPHLIREDGAPHRAGA